jgi:hypothetical protein
VLGELDYVYLPSRDVAADLEHFVGVLGAEVIFAVERFETRVAMLRVDPEGPALLLAEHLHGDQPVLLYRVEDLDGTSAALTQRGAEVGLPFEIPPGVGAEIATPGPQRIAIYEVTRPERIAGMTGRRDF